MSTERNKDFAMLLIQKNQIRDIGVSLQIDIIKIQSQLSNILYNRVDNAIYLKVLEETSMGTLEKIDM